MKGHCGLLYRLFIIILVASNHDFNVKYFNYKTWSSAKLFLLVASASSVSVHKYIFPTPTIRYSFTVFTNITHSQTTSLNFHFCFKAASTDREEWLIYEWIIFSRSVIREWHLWEQLNQVHVLRAAWWRRSPVHRFSDPQQVSNINTASIQRS